MALKQSAVESATKEAEISQIHYRQRGRLDCLETPDHVMGARPAQEFFQATARPVSVVSMKDDGVRSDNSQYLSKGVTSGLECRPFKFASNYRYKTSGDARQLSPFAGSRFE